MTSVKFVDLIGGELPLGMPSCMADLKVISCDVDDSERSVTFNLANKTNISEEDINNAENV